MENCKEDSLKKLSEEIFKEFYPDFEQSVMGIHKDICNRINSIKLNKQDEMILHISTFLSMMSSEIGRVLASLDKELALGCLSMLQYEVMGERDEWCQSLKQKEADSKIP